MPTWLWILIGVLAAIALLIFIIANVDLNVDDALLFTVR